MINPQTNNDPFASIRPFDPNELPDAYERLLANAEFQSILRFLFPNNSVEEIATKMRMQKTNKDFQLAFCYGFLKDLLAKTSTQCDIDTENIDLSKRYTFISNHRDIVLDSALLEKLLVDSNCDTTCEIAIGDNLLAREWIEDLVKINKSFIVRRHTGLKEMLANSRLMSQYIRFVIENKQDNVWMAQREGRAKDSNDRTQSSILKMLSMQGEGSIMQKLSDLHIVPLSISYQYDPCDYLKAKELQQKRDNPNYNKSKEDDVLSMKTGIFGYKGRIHFHCSKCIDEWLLNTNHGTTKDKIFDDIAKHIDNEIFLGYQLFPNNYVAADIFTGNNTFNEYYCAQQKEEFLHYVESRINLIELENKDEDFLKMQILQMYAYPAINQHNAKQGLK